MLVELIREDELDLRALPPEFVLLAANTLGQAGGPEDGFDALFLPPASRVGEFANALAFYDAALAESDARAAEVVADTLQEETALLARNIDAGREILAAIDDLERETAGEPEPVLTGGGGGGGDGGGGGGGLPCDRARQVDVFLDGIFIGTVCDV